VSSSHKATNLVFVIGESASPFHWSLYGYLMKTTPIVDSWADELIVLSDVATSSTSTAESIVRLLTTMDDEPGNKEWYEYPTVFQIMKEAGYKTYWASNQERTGLWSNMSGILSGDADEIEYVGSVDSEDHLTDSYDEALLPVVKDFLAQDDMLKVIGVHLMGSHLDYVKRYPRNRIIFTENDVCETTSRPWMTKKKARIVAEYDNSIHYTDSVLGLMLNYVKEINAPSVLIYVSDHGENVYDDRDFRGRDEMAQRVPMFIYMNDSYKARNEDIVSQLEKAKNMPYSSSELIHLIMGMTGTDYELRDASADISSKEYRVKTRYVDNEIFKDDKGKQYE
ncbi:MAG: phosphoethanolamine transferase, partial [Muribaculaceae bacterium]|nr:phosphoethanolamine transferase [Muribaculaceae bacterium]